MNTFPTETLVQKEQEMEDSIGLPVSNGSQMVEVGNSKDLMKNGFAQISEWKAHWCTQSVVQCCRDRVQRTTRFLLGS